MATEEMDSVSVALEPINEGRVTPMTRDGTPVSVILPCYEEEMAVRTQIESIRRELYSHGITHEILVVDDGSEDRTAEEALLAQARVLRHSENRGYGAALKTGILAARYDTVVIIDADGTYPAEDIPKLLLKLENCDMVVGARTGDHVQIPFFRRPAKKILGWLANLIAGQRIPDLNSGLRAFRRDCAKQYFSILSNRFSFTTTLTLALLADDYRVIYHPINYGLRVGKSKITPWHFVDFMILVLRMAMLFQPLRVFLPLALALGFVGAVKAAFDVAAMLSRVSTIGWTVLLQPTVSASAVLLLLAGLQFLLIGMVADGVLRRIAQRNRFQVPSCAVWAFESSADTIKERQQPHAGDKSMV